MPEGHLVHRDARAQHDDLVGAVITASSPQGRLDTTTIDGSRLDRVEAYGKHLFHRFESGFVVHVHLGMQGLWLRYPDPATPPRPGTRLRLVGGVAYDLIAPSACEVLDAGGVAAVLDRLGPDPLRPDADAADAVRRFRTARGPVGKAHLDQSVWAGIGNAWRAELLWLARLDPNRPAATLDESTTAALWRTTVHHLTLGRDLGQVVSDSDAPDERWVYKRETCRSCGAAVATGQVGGRTAYWCPKEQV